MNNLKLKDFKSLIACMPVSKRSSIIKKSTWEKIKKKVNNKTFGNKMDLLFRDEEYLIDGQEDIIISREDLFSLAKKRDIQKFIYATIMWGYPAGMQGNNLPNIVAKVNPLVRHLRNIRERIEIQSWQHGLEKIKSITGLGLSTYTKFLYFLKASVEKKEALILDRKLIEVFRKGMFRELNEINEINKENAARKYPDYLRLMYRVARDSELNVKPDQLEMFLYLFGNSLKCSKGCRNQRGL